MQPKAETTCDHSPVPARDGQPGVTPVPAWDSRPVLRAAFGPYPTLDRLRAAHKGDVRLGDFRLGDFRLELADVRPISRAFAPMVRDGAYDVCEMALGTALQALAYGKPLVLLPATLAARAQEGALLCLAGSALSGTGGLGPGGLAGCRVGVRAYSQTTGVWLRGILAEQHGVMPGDVRWVTFEGAHVAEYLDPPWAERAPPGADMLAMLRQGALDAVVVGNDAPQDPGLRCVFPDPAAAGDRFRAAYGFTPVNHVAVASTHLATQHPDWLQDLVGLLPGPADLERATPVMLRFLQEQAMLPRMLPVREVLGSFAGRAGWPATHPL